MTNGEKYYAVTIGRFPGIFTSLHEAETVNANVVRSIQEFSSADEANTYLINNSIFTAVENDLITVLAGVNECGEYLKKHPNAFFVGRSAEKTRIYVRKKPLYLSNPVLLQQVLDDISAAEKKIEAMKAEMGIAAPVAYTAPNPFEIPSVNKSFCENVFNRKITERISGRMIPSLPLYSSPVIWKNYSSVNRNICYVFTDGSAVDNAFSSAYIALFNGKMSSEVKSWTGSFPMEEGAAIAENAAIIMGISKAIKLRAGKVVVIHDGTHQEYALFTAHGEDEERYYTEYRRIVTEMSRHIRIEFALVKGHAACFMHNAADKLASVKNQAVYCDIV